VPAFDEIKDKVKQMATQERQEEVFKAYINEAKQVIPYVDGPEATKAVAKAPGKTPTKGATKNKKAGAAK